MSRKNPTSRPCAAHSCRRIELKPSWRLAVLLAAWLLAFDAMVLCGVSLGLPVRVGICAVAILGGTRAILATFLRVGPDAVRTFGWDDAHLFVILVRSR